MEASSERLPWPTDEPSSTAPPEPSPRTGSRALWPWYLLLSLLIAAVAAIAWWLGTGQREPAPSVLPAEQSIPITPARPADAPSVISEAPEAVGDAVIAAQELPPALRRTARPRQPAAERSARAPSIGSAEDPPAQRGVFPADDAAAAPPLVAPVPVILVNPRPYAGRVVQLGAFPMRSQAEESWRQVTRRYPYLATKPKMVNTVDVRGLGGGRPTRMYRLQLGTSSQAQSVVICQQLERAGHSCVVVY